MVASMGAFAALCACATPSNVSAQSGFVDVPGGPVWYEVMGNGEGAPLITLHGGPGGTSCSLQVLRPLGDDRPVIRYDQLGTGRSGRPDDQSLWNRQRFVDELDALRTELGVEEFHLLGHSWGGALAAYYTLETRGDHVLSLTLSSPLISTEAWIKDTNALRQELPKNVQAVLDEHEAAGTTDSDAYKAATDVFYSLFFTRGEAVEDYDCAGAPGNEAIYLQMWGPTEFHATGSLKDFDLTARLQEIDVPTLFVTGEYDEARQETMMQFSELVPGSNVIVIPDVAHASFTRAPDEYRQIVRGFLESVESTGPDADKVSN